MNTAVRESNLPEAPVSTRILLTLLLLTGPVAHGAEGSGAARQLTEQLVSYTEKGAWPAADRTFRKLQALDEVQLTTDDLFMGAEAARSMGNMLDCRERLIAAFKMGLEDSVTVDERARAWLAELQTEYGHVAMESKGVGTLESTSPPFQPDRRAAIAFASAQLTENGEFNGLLPVGSYTWGKTSFAVDAGTEPVKVKVKGPKK